MTILQEIYVDGHKLAALKLNSKTAGIPVILLHGVTLSINVWRTDPFFETYEAGPCYALSLPGHYPATFPPAFSQKMLTVKMFVEVLTKAICQLVGDQPVILVGHSTGGFSVLALAACNPHLAHGVISLAGFAQGNWIGFYGLQQKIARCGAIGRLVFKVLFQAGVIHCALYRQAWRVVLYDKPAYFSYPKLNTLIENTYFYAKQLDWQAMSYYFSMMPDIDITPMLSGIMAPTLVVTGDKDPTVPSSQATLIARHVPHSELVVVAGAGHMLFVENPSAYTRILSAWLAVE